MIPEVNAIADRLREAIPAEAFAIATFDSGNIQVFLLKTNDLEGEFGAPDFIFPDDLDAILDDFDQLAELLPSSMEASQLREQYGLEYYELTEGLVVYKEA